MRRDDPEWRSAGRVYRVLHRIGRPLLKFSFRIHARGLEHLPARGGALLVMNHHSWADGLVLGAIVHRPIRFIGKAELFRRPTWARFFRAADVIPVDREREGERTRILPPGANAEALRAAVAAIEAGRLVAIYPEATLRPPETQGPYKTGVAALALITGAPVVPVAAVTHRFWPAYATIPRFGRPVHALVGAPIRVERRPEAAEDRAELERVTGEVMAEVRRLHAEADSARARGERWRW